MSTEFTALQIAQILQAEIEGDPDVLVDHLSKIEEGKPGALTFLANPKYTPYLYTTLASVVIVNQDFKPEHPVRPTLLKVENAYVSFARLMEFYEQLQLNRLGISSLAFIAASAELEEDVYVAEFAYIGEKARLGEGVKIYPQVYVGEKVSIGEGSILYPGVKIYPGNQIGRKCILHAGVVIGSDGFGFAPSGGKDYKKVPQQGNVILEDEVEIGANTTIDRATLGSTIIRKGVKLDNLIQIAHNVEIGENTVIAAQSGVAGSARIGKNCMIGGQAGIVGHLTIADGVKIGAQSGIEGNVKQEGIVLLGSPAFDISAYRRSYIHFKNFQQIVKRIERLEKLFTPPPAEEENP